MGREAASRAEHTGLHDAREALLCVVDSEAIEWMAAYEQARERYENEAERYR
jgi:hypothetical protein